MKLIRIIMMAAALVFAANVTVNAQDKGKKTETVVYQTTLDCEGCKKEIMESLPFIKGVKDVKVDVSTKKVTVVIDPAKCDKTKVVAELTKLKFNPKEITENK